MRVEHSIRIRHDGRVYDVTLEDDGEPYRVKVRIGSDPTGQAIWRRVWDDSKKAGETVQTVIDMARDVFMGSSPGFPSMGGIT
jgi:hypothetical protein